MKCEDCHKEFDSNFPYAKLCMGCVMGKTKTKFKKNFDSYYCRKCNMNYYSCKCADRYERVLRDLNDKYLY